VKNYLDESVLAVSAASIMAKVSRDEAIKEIENKVGHPIGVGYPHDPLTISFVENLIREKKELPTFVRKSWVTMDALKEKVFQKKLNLFATKERCKEEAR
jgi:ribonuclease HII